jgi:hypothetical protein
MPLVDKPSRTPLVRAIGIQPVLSLGCQDSSKVAWQGRLRRDAQVSYWRRNFDIQRLSAH